MFSHSCNGTNIFMRWKMKCTIQLGFASLNGTFHLSPHENICTIALTNIYYLYNNQLLNLIKTKKQQYNGTKLHIAVFVGPILFWIRMAHYSVARRVGLVLEHFPFTNAASQWLYVNLVCRFHTRLGRFSPGTPVSSYT